MKPLLALVLALWPVWALAQDGFPALYDVTGVAADDVLNLRAGPGVGHPVRFGLSPGQQGVEVVAQDPATGWLLVGMGEASGWAAPRFLIRTGPDWRAGLPASYQCYGTEPFWSLEIGPGGGQWRDISGTQARVSQDWAAPMPHHSAGRIGAQFTQPQGWMTGVFDRQSCSDGMSDRVFGISVALIGAGAALDGAVSGCCTIAP